MKRNRLLIWLIVALLGAGCASLSSCGTTRSYWGIENEYEFGDYGGHHKKPKKHKKHKKHSHHHHHHHDDDDDDD